METEKIHIYYDKEADYLEVIFGEPTQATYTKVAPDTFMRIDNKTGETKGFSVYNMRKGTMSLKTLNIEIPSSVIRKLNEKNVS